MIRKIITVIILITIFACDNKSANHEKDEKLENGLKILTQLGFDVSNYDFDGERFVVEEDIIISYEQLLGHKKKFNDKKNRAKQYYDKTRWGDDIIVNKHLARDIAITIDPAFNTKIKDAIRGAIKKWNDVNSNVYLHQKNPNYSRAVINFKPMYEPAMDGGYVLGRSTFPIQENNGYKPGDDIYINIHSDLDNYYRRVSDEELVTTAMHEIGHALGLRHTNYFDRNNDGDQSDSEGSGISTQITHIPFTPETYDPGSIMNAFASQSGSDWTEADRIAIKWMYPKSPIHHIGALGQKGGEIIDLEELLFPLDPRIPLIISPFSRCVSAGDHNSPHHWVEPITPFGTEHNIEEEPYRWKAPADKFDHPIPDPVIRFFTNDVKGVNIKFNQEGPLLTLGYSIFNDNDKEIYNDVISDNSVLTDFPENQQITIKFKFLSDEIYKQPELYSFMVEAF